MRISSLPSLPAPPLWLRLVMQVAYPVIGAVLSLVFLGLAALGLLLWPIDRRLALPRCLIMSMWVMWEDIGLVARCWWLRVCSPTGTSPTWEQAHLDAIVETLKSVMHAARVLVGFRVETEGELRLGRPGRPLVVISRHAGPADSLALGWLLARAGRIPRIVLADAMLWDPGVATVLRRLNSYFVPSRSGAGDDRTKGVAHLAGSLKGEDAMLIFPEGRNWSPDRFAEQVERMRERGRDEAADHAATRPWVLEPRSRGVAAIREHAPDVDVLVIAHTGLEMLAGPWKVVRAVPFRNRLLLRGRFFRGEEVPTRPEEVGAWLDEQWTSVNDWVARQVAAREET